MLCARAAGRRPKKAQRRYRPRILCEAAWGELKREIEMYCCDYRQHLWRAGKLRFENLRVIGTRQGLFGRGHLYRDKVMCFEGN